MKIEDRPLTIEDIKKFSEDLQRIPKRKKKGEIQMSVSKWTYEPKKCDGDYCPGDCDNCQKKDEVEETDSNE